MMMARGVVVSYCATSREFAEVVTWIRTAVTALARAFVGVRGARAADEEGS
jgi:hypothetical protein